LTGAVLGVLVSLTSVGAGAIGVTVLLLLYPALATSRIVGADIAHAVPLTLLAGMGHWLLGSVDGSMLISLSIGSVPGTRSVATFRRARPRRCCATCSLPRWYWSACGFFGLDVAGHPIAWLLCG
jgi:uncharacterized protein